MEEIENTKLISMVNIVFSFENSKGHLKWKVSELARSCKISKSLVYYHLGKSKEEILDACIEIVAVHYYGLTSNRIQMIASGNMLDSLKYTRSMFMSNPTFTMFYLRWRMTETEYGRKLEKLDERYQEKLQLLFPHLTPVERQSLQAVFYGLVTSPQNVTEENLIAALKWLPLRPPGA